MEFANRLALSLKEGTNDIPQINQWNEQVEAFLAAPPSTPADPEGDTKEESSEMTVEEVARALHKGIVEAVLQREISSADEAFAETQQAVEKYRETTPVSPVPEHLFELIRAAKNLLRWHIQIFLERKGRVLPSPVATLQSAPLLELLVSILENCALKLDSVQQDISRNISLYLFYATYIAFPGDDGSQQALQQLIVQLKFPELALGILTRACSAALALALIRNLHNAIITLQGAAETILTIKVDWDPTAASFSDPAPWAPQEPSKVDFQSTCVKVLLWALQSEPPFPGPDDDKRGELASEILGALYAIRAGQHLAPGRCDDDLMQLVVKILKLPKMAQDKRIEQCKLSMVSLLMDSNRSFGEYLLQYDGLQDLLDLLMTQVSDVLEKIRVDNSATAALVPILVVLNKYASSNSEILRQTKLFVFPVEAEAAFQEKAQEQQQCESSSQTRQKKNMGPLDAPEGTLRRKLCTLLTWPEGHIKRCAGELMWTLCSSDPTEFVHRVGFGHALPMLSVKGFAKMPVPQS